MVSINQDNLPARVTYRQSRRHLRRPDHELTPKSLQCRRRRDARVDDGLSASHKRTGAKRIYGRKDEDLTEAVGLKPALTAEYKKCGFPDPAIEFLAQEVREAIDRNFWNRIGKDGKPRGPEPSRTSPGWGWVWHYSELAAAAEQTTSLRRDGRAKSRVNYI